MLATLNSIYQMRINRVFRFRPKIQIEKQIGNFLIKTVSNISELRPALELRYQVFHRELMGSPKTSGVDIDTFDSQCDHLIIIDQKSGVVAGTMRLNCSSFNDRFYSAQEFILTRILSRPGEKVEIGRACIHPDYRRGFVMSMLWRGAVDYMVVAKAEWLFGCATIPTENPREAALLYKYFVDQDRVWPEYFAPPTLAYTMPNLNFWIPHFNRPLTTEEQQEAVRLLPSLCRKYLDMGAFVGGEPAYDAEFKCLDFLAILRKEDLNRQQWRRLD